MDFGSKIREARIAKNLRQNELARQIGRSPSYVNKIERKNYKPPPDIISKLAQALDLLENELFRSARTIPPTAAQRIVDNPTLVDLLLADATLIPELMENRVISNPGGGLHFTHGRRVRSAIFKLSALCYPVMLVGIVMGLLHLPGPDFLPLLLTFLVGMLVSRNYILICSEYNLALERLPSWHRLLLRTINPFILILFEPIIHVYDLILTRIFYAILRTNLWVAERRKFPNGAINA